MGDKFAGKVALVTGAGVGIGYAICRSFALEGASVALNDVDGTLASQAAAQINAELGVDRVIGYAGDIGDVNSIRAMVADITAHFKHIDVCVANAGITLFGKFLEYEPAAFDRVMNVNLRGSFFTAQAAARVMVDRQILGRIILMSSVTGVQAMLGLDAYGITKAGIRMMARSLALELGGYGITVNAIAPGATVTERTKQETANYEQDWAALMPTKHANSVDDIASAVLFLASPDAKQITGQTLVIDGGWTLYSPVPPGY